MSAQIDGLKADGLMHMESAADRYWSTTNIGEALPGVANPLGWSVWGDAVEIACRDTFYQMGALAKKDVIVPPVDSDRMIAIFYGRAALSINYFASMGDLLPGTSGEAIAVQLLGKMPDGLTSKNSLKRMHAVAVMMPRALIQVPKNVNGMGARTKVWWAERVPKLDTLDLAGSRRMLAEGREQFAEAIRIQAHGVFIGVQGSLDQLLMLVKKSGVSDEVANAIMSGHGQHAETALVDDLWELSRERITLDEFIKRHGYHGPAEGDVSSRVWREDSSPVERLAAQYAKRPESDNPALTSAQRVREREAAEKTLLESLPKWKRAGAKVVLKMGVSRIPLRGVAKAAFLQSLDIVRGSARRMGVLMAEEGTLEHADDVFMFTADELIRGLGPDAKAIAAERKAVFQQLTKINVPSDWRGNPEPVAVLDHSAAAEEGTVAGIGASGGIVEGVVQVVEDPAFADDFPEDSIIVCETTDPSWASVLFLASAFVVDIGGLLSHAAVVARELGVPCVMGTGNGTRVLRTGDRIRVNGNDGSVEILQKA